MMEMNIGEQKVFYVRGTANEVKGRYLPCIV
jgi:hypothetical protein